MNHKCTEFLNVIARTREAIGRATTDELQGVGWRVASLSVYRAAHRCSVSLFSE
jgi:hypothetical protein